MNVLRIEKLSETANEVKYKIIYEEKDVIETTLKGRSFYYDDEEEAKCIPNDVLDFAEFWILGDLQQEANNYEIRSDNRCNFGCRY